MRAIVAQIDRLRVGISRGDLASRDESRNRNGSNPILCAKSHDRSIDWIGATFQISSMNQTGKFIFLLARFHRPTSVERSEACPRPPTTGRAALGAAAQLVGRLKELKWADRDPRWRARGWMLRWRAFRSLQEASRGFESLREACRGFELALAAERSSP